MKHQAVNAKDAPLASGSYAQGIEVVSPWRWPYVSGQIPETPSGEIPGGFWAQCRRVWANVEAQLRAGGLSLSHLVKVTTFLSERFYATENSRIRQEVLKGLTPALTVIITEIYDPRWLLEIEVVTAEQARKRDIFRPPLLIRGGALHTCHRRERLSVGQWYRCRAFLSPRRWLLQSTVRLLNRTSGPARCRHRG